MRRRSHHAPSSPPAGPAGQVPPSRAPRPGPEHASTRPGAVELGGGLDAPVTSSAAIARPRRHPEPLNGRRALAGDRGSSAGGRARTCFRLTMATAARSVQTATHQARRRRDDSVDAIALTPLLGGDCRSVLDTTRTPVDVRLVERDELSTRCPAAHHHRLSRRRGRRRGQPRFVLRPHGGLGCPGRRRRRLPRWGAGRHRRWRHRCRQCVPRFAGLRRRNAEPDDTAPRLHVQLRARRYELQLPGRANPVAAPRLRDGDRQPPKFGSSGGAPQRRFPERVR
jgi:hypothetical protein